MERTLRFDITLTPVVNYALQQNRVKMIQEITLINDGDVDLVLFAVIPEQ